MSTTQQTPGALKRTVPLLIVSDIEQSRQFYGDGLGFHLEDEWRPDGRLAWCLMQREGAALMLQQSCDEDPPPSTWGHGVTIYFICSDADQIYQELIDHGVEATVPMEAFYGMNQTFITDPDGYMLCFENPTNKVKA